MALIVPPPHGMPVPNRLHAVSVQISTWQDVCAISVGTIEAVNALKNGYPRSYVHTSVQSLFQACEGQFSNLDGKVMLFSNAGAAEACKAYMISNNLHGQKAAHSNTISLYCIEFGKSNSLDLAFDLPPLFLVMHSADSSRLAALFWRLTGTGISSRLAERYLKVLDKIQKVDTITRTPYGVFHPVYKTISDRIANLIERSPVGSPRKLKVRSEDVYLYPSGMSAIYHTHHLLLHWRGAESIVLGFTYELTLKIMETYGPSHKFYSAGTDKDIDDFERYLDGKFHQGSTIQAVWCECPSNPLLRTVNLERVRRLADKYDFIVVVDDTIGSFANIDILGIADIVITSLTKSYNGFADVLAGSAILNPNSRHYRELKYSLDASYLNNFYVDDAIQLEINSRNFLQRAAHLNDSAAYLVDNIFPYVSDPNSAVINVYYPKVCWSAENYQSRMRPATDEFTPGYGGLFTIEFETVEIAAAFFDSLELHKGPSLGAHITLALPYVQMVFQKEKEWAARNGVRETIVRISVGLEDKEAILKCVKRALMAADKINSGI